MNINYLFQTLNGARVAFLILVLFLVLSLKAYANKSDIPDFLAKSLPNAQIVGNGSLTWVFWDVYDAQLIAPDGQYAPEQPFALLLTYKRHVDGNVIADSSADEIKRQGFNDEKRLATWHAMMTKIFPDVNANTSLAGLYTPSQSTCFFKNDHPIGCIDDPLFGKYFFNIWLGENTRDPDLRLSLLGKNTPSKQ